MQSSAALRPYYSWFMAMHTRMDLLLCMENPEISSWVVNEIKDEVQRLELLANRFDTQSELSKINRDASVLPVTISRELSGIISDCIDYYHLTDGCFNITVNSLENLKDTISLIELDLSVPSVYYRHTGVQIDLSGYIKGYALRSVKKILLRYQISDALVSFGNSSIMAMGNHPSGKGWKVDCALFDECLTTSGNSPDHLHIIQPETGKYVHPFSPISVITADPAIGEVLSTALCVIADTEQRMALLEKLGGRIFV